MNRLQLFNDGWEFMKQDINSAFDISEIENGVFVPVDIPHDWLIYDTYHLYKSSIGWYRKRFTLFSQEKDVFILRFDGVYMDSSIFINKQKIGEWKYGYSTFEFDINDYVYDGENEVLVRVNYQSPNSRWYTGAGIYRNVWLKRLHETHIVSDGIYIHTKKGQHGWYVNVSTEVICKENAYLQNTILYDNKTIATTNKAKLNQGIGTVKQTLFIDNPLLWDIDSPNLYQIRTELFLDETKDKSIDISVDESMDNTLSELLIETQVQNFGFRSIEFHPDNGFILNGRQVKIQGVCEHHDLGCLGAAFNLAAMRRKFMTLKEMGVNGVRTTHNMPAVEVMELADEMGILIVSESFDMW